LGEEPYDIRYNDDGEPTGTAGKPIFGQIQSFELTNVLIVVIRYFGGVKLGTGGLIQAYRAAAKAAITNGKIITKTWKATLEIRFSYLLMNDVMRIIKDEGLRIVSQESREPSCILLEIRKGQLDEVIRKFSLLEKVDCTVI
jgi:putative IMPACT (imprinted ancient) family translation regulator